MNEDNKLYQELDQRAETTFKKRVDTFVALEVLFNSYQEGIGAIQRLRNNTDSKIREFSEGKIDAFNKIKKVVHNIEVYEKNKHKIYRKLTALNSRKDALAEIYKTLIKGGIPQKNELEKPMFTGYLRLYEEVFEPILTASNEDISLMFSRKDDYVNGINLFFSRLQEDIGDIDAEIKRLLKIESDVENKLRNSKSHQNKLQKNYAIYTDQIKNTKMKLGVILKDERVLLSDYEHVLKSCEDITQSDERMTERLKDALKITGDVNISSCSFEVVDEVHDPNLDKDAENIENSSIMAASMESTDGEVDGIEDEKFNGETEAAIDDAIDFASEKMSSNESDESDEKTFAKDEKKEESGQGMDLINKIKNAIKDEVDSENEMAVKKANAGEKNDEETEVAETESQEDEEGLPEFSLDEEHQEEEVSEAISEENEEFLAEFSLDEEHEEEEVTEAASQEEGNDNEDTNTKGAKRTGEKKKKKSSDESILSPAKNIEESDEEESNENRDSILSTAKEGKEEKKKKDIEDIITNEPKAMLNDESFLLDLSETLQ
ncbi:MAG: hypothetical protein HQK84_04085 [Nitrospinae bacterium]|nr:hypothetical protein [Nitrospinota bacterium]